MTWDDPHSTSPWCLFFCLCSASSGHQWEPQRLCDANAAISSCCWISCVCHLQIQKVKCSWNIYGAITGCVMKEAWRRKSWADAVHQISAGGWGLGVLLNWPDFTGPFRILKPNTGYSLTRLKGNEFVRSFSNKEQSVRRHPIVNRKSFKHQQLTFLKWCLFAQKQMHTGSQTAVLLHHTN